MAEKRRCQWVNLSNPVYVRYHDEEWGQPVHDDRKLFEMLLLESFQAGLSWECILNKRGNFRRAFCDFDAAKVAAFNETDVARLMNDAGIVRHRRKIEAAVSNSRVFLQIQAECGSFNAYIWHFTNGQTLTEPYYEHTKSALSDAVAKDLKRRGMRFFGSTTAYSFLQAVGIINGHGSECWLSREK